MTERRATAPGADTVPEHPPTPKGRNSRERLLAAATTLFAERGYARVRITDITEAAGLSPGAFYRYFTDRRELMLVLMRALTDEVFDFVRVPWDESDPVATVSLSTRRYFQFYLEHRGFFAVLVELAQTDAEVGRIWADSRRAFYARIAQSLRRGMESGTVRADVDVTVAAELLGGMTEFYAFQRLVLADGAVTEVPLDQAARHLAEIWTSGVLRRNLPSSAHEPVAGFAPPGHGE
ncbi:TetR/AcrR family transcriptional regulator [Nocardia sp. alder85J]|uniref:TetR/AcrR family transcriptional regulator n=1 Tax=Nocardia sp. alder85J TaxID=2862949 RepID=UPI001CD37739|nr:TetR/AcrR family transcriptional regulator [Nocardia sp. alder85J]MCX4092388.1 TetR/AcrR family transcriptional regulator [Nocardia sp. alder85J]